MNTNSEIDFSISQAEGLKKILEYVSKKSPFYKQLFYENKIEINKIKTIDDLKHIPPTTKEDLQKNYEDFLCVPKNRIADYVNTSGTLGRPVDIILTEKDLKRLAYNEYRALSLAGIQKNDVVQLTVTIDRCFLAGLAYYSGLRKIGAATIRVGPSNPELQWETISRIKPNVLIAVPSFIIKLIEYANAQNIEINKSSIKKIICIGEAIRKQDLSWNEIGKKIKSNWNVELLSTYASTEISTAFTESSEGSGGHLIPELAIIETLDENNLPVKNGEIGELTITTLQTEGMPLIRFKTGDLCIIYKSQDSENLQEWKISPIIGRKKQMIKFKGTTLYPQALIDILNGIKQLNDYFIELSTNSIGTDHIKIFVSLNDQENIFLNQLVEIFRSKIRVAPEITMSTKEQIEMLKLNPKSRKPIQFIDLRNN